MPNQVPTLYDTRLNEANGNIKRLLANSDNIEILSITPSAGRDFNTIVKVRIDVYPEIGEDDPLPEGAKQKYIVRSQKLMRAHITNALTALLGRPGKSFIFDSSAFEEGVDLETLTNYFQDIGLGLEAGEFTITPVGDRFKLDVTNSVNFYGVVYFSTGEPTEVPEEPEPPVDLGNFTATAKLNFKETGEEVTRAQYVNPGDELFLILNFTGTIATTQTLTVLPDNPAHADAFLIDGEYEITPTTTELIIPIIAANPTSNVDGAGFRIFKEDETQVVLASPLFITVPPVTLGSLAFGGPPVIPANADKIVLTWTNAPANYSHHDALVWEITRNGNTLAATKVLLTENHRTVEFTFIDTLVEGDDLALKLTVDGVSGTHTVEVLAAA